MEGTDSLVSLRKIYKYSKAEAGHLKDLLAVESPLQIRLEFEKNHEWHKKDLLVTMRSPGNDFDLALGFLFAEGIVESNRDILLMRYCQRVKPEEKGNVLIVKFVEGFKVDLKKLERNFYTNSSCGVCGKTAIDAVKCVNDVLPINHQWQINPETILSIPKNLLTSQTAFKYTGGLHAAALYDQNGNLLLLREDIGRHNALDKLIGACLKENIDLSKEKIVLLSGRVSYEMAQKAINAGIPVVLAFGPPTQLAVDLAQEKKMTLIGFLKEESFNIYSGEERIKIVGKKIF
ncbi:MAG: formate dehydrogenase accessory sulfurtransferase FdhD [Cytophagales bacterium]|uniref:formate dehydrogenase accessory sulfurtransferase FdhD n=1 Tax=Cyclobacterium marinum TaxID=104 RepID=UPI0011ED78A8|nr:formate dehydrogenase accessory sulfurtransferase FdhD [Cyclobacterium marinum]MBI0397175.1 formate dehydrogenase accessory sulfurtransferase FdhD [Cyclobacterium marinum]MBR9778102.1 formate dehydrogenase accessory sulfurtransferase FdhD [Cytophagales bacterium]|tara:strand:- start:20577 stop:21446 length:870 start_codon:yes stop_codon:yes gene_type:complete